MLKMQILRPRPQTTESKTLGLWPSNLFFNKSFRGFWCTSFKAHLLVFRKERKGTLIFFMRNWEQCLWRQVTSGKCRHGCPQMDINPSSWPSMERAVREDHSHLSVRYIIMWRCRSGTHECSARGPTVGVQQIVTELRNKGGYAEDKSPQCVLLLKLLSPLLHRNPGTSNFLCMGLLTPHLCTSASLLNRKSMWFVWD